MYSKCGSIEEAKSIFEYFQKEKKLMDVITWNSMINAYGIHGFGKEALDLFKQMQDEGFEPDSTSIVCILTACSHSGLIDDAINIFNSMKEKYKILPEEKHFNCLIDVLGRAGRLDEAENIINNMKIKPGELH